MNIRKDHLGVVYTLRDLFLRGLRNVSTNYLKGILIKEDLVSKREEEKREKSLDIISNNRGNIGITKVVEKDPQRSSNNYSGNTQLVTSSDYVFPHRLINITKHSILRRH
jgi:hypothetical protein